MKSVETTGSFNTVVWNSKVNKGVCPCCGMVIRK